MAKPKIASFATEKHKLPFLKIKIYLLDKFKGAEINLST